MEHKSTVDNAIAAIRISSTKQGLQGDSPDDQKQQLIRFAELHNINIVKFFTFVQSASGEFQPNQEAIDFCKDPKNDVQLFLIKSIDRFTRGGAYFYSYLKNQLIKYGVKLVDLYGIIGTQSVNTLSHLDIKYSWSEFNPSFKSELLEAERGKDEIRDILTRMIGAEIRYVRMGYRVRQPPYGYVNAKIDTIHGKRVILKPNPQEASFIIQMFELRIQGNLTDEEIVEKINLLGYKSRISNLHDKNNHVKVIGHRGGQALSVKQLQRYITRPIYVGINTEKWTNGIPVKAQFDGLITIDMFNKANRGRVTIIEEGANIKIYTGQPPIWQLLKNKDNPLYPYKQYVTCPRCDKPLLGSAFRGKSGKRFPYYHCNRGHYFGVNISNFDVTITTFCENLHFNPEFQKRFGEIVLEEWNKRQRSVSELTISLNKQVADIEMEINMLKDKIKSLSSKMVIDMLVKDIEEVQQKKAKLIQKRDNREDEQVNIETLIAYVEYYMEHLHDLLLEGSNKQKNAAMFGLVFEKTPTYDDLTNGTPTLSPLFVLNDAYKTSKKQMVNVFEQIRTHLKGSGG